VEGLLQDEQAAERRASEAAAAAAAASGALAAAEQRGSGLAEELSRAREAVQVIGEAYERALKKSARKLVHLASQYEALQQVRNPSEGDRMSWPSQTGRRTCILAGCRRLQWCFRSMHLALSFAVLCLVPRHSGFRAPGMQDMSRSVLQVEELQAQLAHVLNAEEESAADARAQAREERGVDCGGDNPC